MTEAEEAAAHWGGTGLRLIRDRENAVYEMQTPRGRAALRLHRAGYQGEAAIRSELWWCAELVRAGLPVAEPLSAGDALLVRLGSGRAASALRWLAGEPMGLAGQPLPGTAQDQVRLHFDLGRLLAQMHKATDALTLPDWFTRPRWDVEGLTGEQPFWGRFWDHPALTAGERSRMHEARSFLWTEVQAHANGGGDFGPIHADVLRENVLVNGGSLSLIDFDDAGLGFRLYDLGTVMSQNLYQPNLTNLRDALIGGYRTLRPADSRMVDVLTLARTCASVGWTMPRLPPGDPVHRSHIERALMWFQKVAG